MNRFLKVFSAFFIVKTFFFGSYVTAVLPQYENDFASGNLRLVHLSLSSAQLGAGYYGGTPDLDKIVYYIASSDPLKAESDTDIKSLFTALDLTAPPKDVSARATPVDHLWGLLKDPQRTMAGSSATDIKVDKNLADLTIALLHLRQDLNHADPAFAVNELARLGKAQNPHALYWMAHLLKEGYHPGNISVSLPKAVAIFQAAVAAGAGYADAASWLRDKGYPLTADNGKFTAAEREQIRAGEAGRFASIVGYLAKRNHTCARCSNFFEVCEIITNVTAFLLPIAGALASDPVIAYCASVASGVALACKYLVKRTNSEAVEASGMRLKKLHANGFGDADDGLSNPSADGTDAGPTALTKV